MQVVLRRCPFADMPHCRSRLDVITLVMMIRKRNEISRTEWMSLTYTSMAPMRVRTHAGAALRVRRANGEVFHARDPGDQQSSADLILVRDLAAPERALALAATEHALSLHFQYPDQAAPLLAVRLCRHGAHKVAIRHAASDHHLCAHPFTTENEAPVTLDRPQVGGWELFDIVEMDPADIPPRLVGIVTKLLGLLAAPLDEAVLIGLLDHEPSEFMAAAGAALLSFAPPASRHAVGAAAIGSARPAERLAERLATVWPTDRVSRLLPELAAWSRTRPRRSIINVDDAGTPVQPSDERVPLTSLLAAARAAVTPRKVLAVLSSARNEGIYLLDWIAHHRAIGVEHFFLYSNDNDDASDRMLRSLAEAGIVTYLPQVASGSSAQDRAFRHALSELPDILDYRWTAIIDADEFIVIDPARFRSLPAFLDLQQSRGADAVALNWRMFTPAGQHLFQDQPVTERLLRREPNVNPHVKSIVRTARAVHSTPHAPFWPPHAPGATLDAAGFPHHGTNRPFWDSQFRHHHDPGPVWVNHYFMRSLPEYVWKAARNRGDAAACALHFPTGHGFLDHFLSWFDHSCAVEDRTILHARRDADDQRRHLLAIDGVADAHAESVRIFLAIVTRLFHDILAQADQLPDRNRAAFTSLIERSLADGVVAGACPRVQRSAGA